MSNPSEHFNKTEAKGMDMTQLISVIIPVYNTVEYLNPCLESVCHQTYANLEMLLVDDGSTDGSGALCDEWADRDSRIIVIHQKNAGVSAARNAGLAACTGALLFFVDSDDWLDTSVLKKLQAQLVRSSADVAICGYVEYRNGRTIERGVFPVAPTDFKGSLFQMMRKGGNTTSVWAKLYRRSRVFHQEGYLRFDPEFLYGEDDVWLIQVLSKCDLVAFLPEALYHYRARVGSITKAETITEKNLTRLKSTRVVLSLLPDDPAIRSVAVGCLFNNCYNLKTLSYLSGDTVSMQRVNQTLKPMWRDWLRCREVSPARKVKVLILEAETLLHMPKLIVRSTDNLK